MPDLIPGQQLLRHAAHYLGAISEAIAVLIIAMAVLTALSQMVRGQFLRIRSDSEVRINLGRSLTLALEFMLAGDVVRTAVAPSWDDLGKLAAVAVIRTGLNYFLNRDIRDSGPVAPESG
jgi:uncharacterized membrane protein